MSACYFFFFFFNDTATTEIYTLSLHDALPISRRTHRPRELHEHPPDRRRAHPVAAGTHRPTRPEIGRRLAIGAGAARDRKSTRLNSSHSQISYAVFCLKKKKNKKYNAHYPATS